MTRSELKSIIREMLHEELKSLREATDRPMALRLPQPVRANSFAALAAKIYNSDEFMDAFIEDGQTIGDTVDAIIYDAVAKSHILLMMA